MSTPYVGFGNDQLANAPPLKAGDHVTCPNCSGQHMVEDSKPPMLLFYKCGDATYFAGMRGRNLMNVKAACSGELTSAEVAAKS